MMTGDLDQAHRAWIPLDQLGEDDALRVFKDGMTRFLDENYEEAIAFLKRGIELNEASESLNDNMERVIEQAQAALEAQGQKDKAAPPKAPPRAKVDKRAIADRQHVLLAGYRKQGEKQQ
jgi:hypothetical protein